MDTFGVNGFWGFISVLLLGLAAYGLWRMTQRKTTTAVEDLVSYTPITATASPVMAVAMQEVYLETEAETDSVSDTDAAAAPEAEPEPEPEAKAVTKATE
jgi:NADH:ubiquinone oxidoreductase subunit 2 (subunit N)